MRLLAILLSLPALATAFAQTTAPPIALDGRIFLAQANESIHTPEGAAAQSNAQADFDLGINYELGRGVAHNRTKAMQYLRKSTIDDGKPDGKQIAAALARTAPSLRFATRAALMALVPSPAPNRVTGKPGGCPDLSARTFPFANRNHLIAVSRRFCSLHPGCPFSVDLHEYTCDGNQTPLQRR